VLGHATQREIFERGMPGELKRRDFRIGPGTLYAPTGAHGGQFRAGAQGARSGVHGAVGVGPLYRDKGLTVMRCRVRKLIGTDRAGQSMGVVCGVQKGTKNTCAGR